jgi:hypothetical protein
MGDLAFLSRLRPVSAAEAAPTGAPVADDVAPLVRLLEETPRGRLLEEVAQRISAGASYQQVLAALLLAGVRNIQPRPEVGFKFHAVLVVNSAHVASLASPDAHRWLPIFWALDHFKQAQAQDVSEGDWRMAAVDESALPGPGQVRARLMAGLDAWDAGQVDPAAAALARFGTPHEAFELLFRYGARDFRSIGHKAIFVANSLRTLQCIGWRHAEPVLRSLAYALVKHDGTNPASGDLEPDRPWKTNLERAAKIRGDWPLGKLDAAASSELLAVFRQGSADEACDKAVELLNRQIAPQSLWDAVFVAAGELLARQPGIVALHAVTSSNALRYAYDTSGQDETRRMMLLQNVAFLPLFRRAMERRGPLRPFELDRREGAAPQGDAPVQQIFAQVGRDNDAALQAMLGHLDGGGSARELIDAARLLVFLKGDNSHDYKFSSAVLEDYDHVSPGWRNRFLASSVFSLRGSSDPDNALVQRTRAALGS